MSTALLVLLSAIGVATPNTPSTDLREVASAFLRRITVPFELEELRQEPVRVPGQTRFSIGELHSVDIQVQGAVVAGYRFEARMRERSFGRRRDVSLTLITEEQARVKAQGLLDALGLDKVFEIKSITLDPEEVSPKDPRRMKSFGSAHVKANKIGDPPTLRGGNGWSVAYDRFDGAVLYYGHHDRLRFVEEPDNLGAKGARRAADGIWAEIDRLDPEVFPPAWRPVTKVEQGWSIIGGAWIKAYRSEHNAEPLHIPVVPAYKVWFSNPLRQEQTEPGWVFLRASNGELMHDGRF